MVAEKYTYRRKKKTTGRIETVTRYRAVAITENIEAAKGLNSQEHYPWQWKIGTKRGRPVARVTKLFGEGRKGKSEAKQWERKRYREIREWKITRKTIQRIETFHRGPLVPDVVDEYLEEAKQFHPNTYGNKDRFLRRGIEGDDTQPPTNVDKFFKRAHGSVVPLAQHFKYKPLNEIDRAALENYLDYQYPDKSDKVANRKYNNHRKEIRSFFSWVVRKYKWSVHPAREIPARPASVAERKVATKGDVDKMIEVAEGQAKNLLATLWWTAGRREQVLALNWDDVDLETKQLRMKTAKSKDGSVKEKYIPILPWLEPFLRNQQDKYRHLSKDGSVFININLAHKSSPNYRRRYRYNTNFVTRHCDAAGVPRFSYHAMRRGLATYLYDHDVDYIDIQAILGHDDVETTKRYVHSLRPSRKAREAIIEKLNGILKD